jgi:2-polyprenyl-3-methyl-5-hydroxy-6-metoxy-1,4-benzoquinol methylase
MQVVTSKETATDSFCPICHHETDRLKGPSVYRLQRCFHCQAIYLNTAPQKLTDYAAEVERQYFGREFAEKSDDWSTLYEKWNNQRTLRRVSSATGESEPRLLEIGIGSGRLLQAASQAGWCAVGIEASSAVAAHVRQRYGVPVFAGLIEEYDNSFGHKFDVVIMNHVLEHIPDPVTALSKVRDLLKPDGILHLAVPNIECWEAHFPGWTSYEPYHLFYFGRDSLTTLLRQCSYRIHSIQSYEPFSGWVNTLLRTALETDRHQANPQIAGKADDAQGQGISRRKILRDGFELARLTAGSILSPLRMVQSSLGKGEELIIIASPE